jgi:hypothetical protein
MAHAMTLDQAQDEFEAKPTKQSAGNYWTELERYHEAEMIGNDTYAHGLLSIKKWLTS